MSDVKKIENLTFEFVYVTPSDDIFNFSGLIKSIDWDSEMALVDITPDGIVVWDRLTGCSHLSFPVSLINLIRSTENVSSKSYNQLLQLLKLNYRS
jgi:hypothetical protein